MLFTKKQNKPLVSIITAFYNEERFLEETIRSVLAQTYKNWELILIDDGSADGSTDIAKRYAKTYKGKIIYTEHEDHHNRGLSASRNLGISIAHGGLLALLDADDVWLAKKLKLQVEIMEKNPSVAMLCEASTYWYTWNNKKVADLKIKIGYDQDKIYYPPELLETLYPLSSGYAPVPSALMVRKEIALKHGCFEAHFTGKFQLYEDQGFLHKIYLNEEVYISSNCNNKYRQRAGSLVQSIRGEGSYDIVRKYFLDWLKQYMQENNFLSERTEPLLKKAFRRYEERNNPFITIITIFRNHELYLRQTIESILSQSYTHWEYILIDDGATDTSRQIAESYASEHEKISLFNHENFMHKGEMASRNVALRYARGEYAAFADVNYLWLPGKLQNQVDEVKQFAAAGILFERVIVSDAEEADVDAETLGLDIDKLFLAPDLFFKMEPFGNENAPYIGTALIDTGLLQSIDNFDETFVGENSSYGYFAMLVKAYLNFSVYFSSSSNTIYRTLPPECYASEINAGNRKEGRGYFLKWAKKYLKGYKRDYPVTGIVLRKAFLAHRFPFGYKIGFEQYVKMKVFIKQNKHLYQWFKTKKSKFL